MKTSTRAIDQIVVCAHADESHRGTLTYRDHQIPCALGRSGISQDKHEGDGATPAGSWPLRRVLYRPDRIVEFTTLLPAEAIGPDDGWCDAPGDSRYNQQVSLPHERSHERLWRNDGLYDLLIVLGYNDDSVIPGAGSAIFFHLASQDYRPTEGCIAISHAHMLDILQYCDENTRMIVSTKWSQAT